MARTLSNTITTKFFTFRTAKAEVQATHKIGRRRLGSLCPTSIRQPMRARRKSMTRMASQFPRAQLLQAQQQLPVVVMKFGGSSLGNAEAIHRSCQIAYDGFCKGQNVVVVVSALYGVTNRLEEACHAAKKGDMDTVARMRSELRQFHLQQADDIFSGNDRFLMRFRLAVDRILGEYFDPNVAKIAESGEFEDNWFAVVSSLGERLSVPLVCACLSFQGLDTVEVYTDKLIVRDERNPEAAFNGVDMEDTSARLQNRLLPLLNTGIMPIVSGFIAGNEHGSTTTLGRGGSDLSSTLVANAVGAESVHLWKVEADSESGLMHSWKRLLEQTKWTGIRSVDPTEVKTSRIVERMTYSEATELSHFGKKVLHPVTMAPVADRGDVTIYVRNTAMPSHPGTAICATADEADPVVCVITSLSFSKYKSLHERSAASKLGALFEAVEALPEEPAIVSLIGTDISADQQAIYEQMAMELMSNGIQPITIEEGLMKHLGTTSSVSVLLRQDDVNDALRVLHNAFVVEEALEAPSEDDFEWLKTTSQVEDMVWSAGTAYQNNAQLAFQSHASVQMATALR